MARRRLVPLSLVSLFVLALASAIWLVEGPFTQAALTAQLMPSPSATPLPPATPLSSPTPSSNTLVLESDLESIYNKVAPSVVNIQVTEQATPTPFGQQQTQALGSGIVWDTDGHIVTNNHVVQGAVDITVTFMDGTSVPAKVVGRDPGSDLAVIQVSSQGLNLQPITVGDSSQVKVGQIAVAIGNPYGLSGTMTMGIISALGRALPVSQNGSTQGPSYQIPDVIQTDASINPGNSGGVLVNINGQLIGVPTAIISSTQGSVGIGFAISSALVRKVIPDLIKTGSYQHPYLGVALVSMTSQIAKAMGLPSSQRGALITDVASGGPAEKAGLRAGTQTMTIQGQQISVGGDIIIGIDGQPVHQADDLISYLSSNTRPEQTVTLTILRNGKQQDVKVTLGARPTSG